MRLLVDLGGSRIKWALSGAGDRPGPMSAGDWREHGLRALLDRHWRPLPRPEALLLASVRGAELLEPLEAWSLEHWGLWPLQVTTSAGALGVRNAYAQPERLGVDRWMALLAAHHHVRGAVCVVDAGTAVTIDVVAADGLHLGGLIAPGMQLMREALAFRTRARAVDDTGCRAALARGTEDAVSAGCALAAAALVERTLADTRQRLGADLACLLTGGDARALAALLGPGAHAEVLPDLVLRGLALLAPTLINRPESA